MNQFYQYTHSYDHCPLSSNFASSINDDRTHGWSQHQQNPKEWNEIKTTKPDNQTLGLEPRDQRSPQPHDFPHLPISLLTRLAPRCVKDKDKHNDKDTVEVKTKTGKKLKTEKKNPPPPRILAHQTCSQVKKTKTNTEKTKTDVKTKTENKFSTGLVDDSICPDYIR